MTPSGEEPQLRIDAHVGKDARLVGIGTNITQTAINQQITIPLRATRPIPPRPRTLYGRQDLLDEVAAALVDPAQPHCHALCGLPGVGKSAAALALAHHPLIQATFPGGVLWLPLGPMADLFGLLGHTLLTFGVATDQLTDLAGRVALLRNLLAESPTLLLLDDVWERNAAQPLLDACAPTTALLLTARRELLATELGATVHLLPLLAAVPARRLLGEQVDAVVAADSATANALTAELGHLPLALHVANRRLQRLVRAQDPQPLARLRAEIADQRRLLDLRAAARRLGIADAEPALAAVIALSYDHLPTDASRLAFCQLAVFGAEPLDFDAAAMQAIWLADSEHAATVVEAIALELRIALIEAGLLQVVHSTAAGSTATARFSLHQLIAHFAAFRLAEEPAAARLAALRHATWAGRLVAGYDDALQQGAMTYQLPIE